MTKIYFSYNWNNKLNCEVFTTIRLSSSFKVGEKLEVILKGKFLGHGQIVDIRGFYLKNLSEWVAMIDTGYSADECRELLKKTHKKRNINWDTQVIRVILIKKIESPLIKSSLNIVKP